MSFRFPSTRGAAAATVLAAVVAAASIGTVRAERAMPVAGKNYICRGLQPTRQCLYVQVAYGTEWGIWVDSDHNGINANVVNGFGLRTISLTGAGVDAESSAYKEPVIEAIAHNASTNLFHARNGKTKKSCLIDPYANLTCSGKLTGDATLIHHRNGAGQEVLAYGSESATATIEDVGTARMINGVANVRIDPAFAAVTDRKWYYVFLTPLGETRGLFVSVKTAAGFQVRETERGHSNLEFDYRIVAHPIDAGDARLPAAEPTSN